MKEYCPGLIDIASYMLYNIEHMAKIITTTQLQKTIGQLLSYVTQSWVVVTKKGRPTAIMLPYFDDNEEAVSDYLEEYEMHANREVLIARYKKSVESGRSSLVI
jgi:PHD/YefM family antitoxin component YafN of YafNO toxin-antitoxin module